jgi:hypothetical protein
VIILLAGVIGGLLGVAGVMGGGHSETAYRRFVEEGLATMPEIPFLESVGGWQQYGPKCVDLGASWVDVAVASRRGPRRASAGVLRLPGGPGGRGRALWDRRGLLLAAAQRRAGGEPGSGRLAGAEVDARVALSAVGLRADPSRQRALGASRERRPDSAISLRLGPASTARRRRASLCSMAPFPAHSWTAATRKPTRLPRSTGAYLLRDPGRQSLALMFQLPPRITR